MTYPASIASTTTDTGSFRCHQCGRVSVSAEIGEPGSDLILWCAHCEQPIGIFQRGRWRLDEAELQPHRDSLHPAEDRAGWWYLGLIRDQSGEFVPITASATLRGCWDGLLSAWCDGDRLILPQRGKPPWHGRTGEPVPNLPEGLFTGRGSEQFTKQDRTSRPAQGKRSEKVPCEVTRYSSSVEAQCSKCGNVTECRGNGDGSVKRALAMMREECPEKATNHFYVEDE